MRKGSKLTQENKDKIRASQKRYYATRSQEQKDKTSEKLRVAWDRRKAKKKLAQSSTGGCCMNVQGSMWDIDNPLSGKKLWEIIEFLRTRYHVGTSMVKISGRLELRFIVLEENENEIKAEILGQ